MKKSFTLIEMMISIVLFSIVMIFLYQALNITQKSNKFYKKKLSKFKSKSQLNKLIFEDITNANSNIKLSKDKEDNTILQFKTSNLYHNPFFINITYLVTKENNLIRIESKIAFNKKKIYNFIDDTYIDIIDTNISKFKVSKNKNIKNNYIFYIEHKDKFNQIFSVSKFN